MLKSKIKKLLGSILKISMDEQEIHRVYVEIKSWGPRNLKLGERLRFYRDMPTGDTVKDDYITYWHVQLPLGLAVAIHPPSRLINWLRQKTT